jgi:hypothetical protein
MGGGDSVQFLLLLPGKPGEKDINKVQFFQIIKTSGPGQIRLQPG